MTIENPWKKYDTVWVLSPIDEEPDEGLVMGPGMQGEHHFRVPVTFKREPEETGWFVLPWLYKTKEAAEVALAQRKVDEAQINLDEWAPVMAHYQKTLDEAKANLDACKAKLPK